MKYAGFAIRFLLLCALAAAAGPLAAQSAYPNRPIRLIIPYAPGGGTDILGRLLAQELSEALRQPVVAENRTGANGIVASSFVAKATPDGYTLILATNGTHGINGNLYKNVPYDAIKDFTPIVLIGEVPMLLVVLPAAQLNSVAELIAWARAKDGNVNYGSSGTGGTGHLTAAMFNTATGIKASHIPYKSDGPALADLLGGQFSYIFSNMPASLPFVKAGRMRVLAVSTARRSPLLPDVPTLMESNVPVETIPWYGVLAPALTPPEIVGRINGEMNKILARPEYKKRLIDMGVDVLGGTPGQLTAQIQSDIAKYAKAVEESGARVE